MASDKKSDKNRFAEFPRERPRNIGRREESPFERERNNAGKTME